MISIWNCVSSLILLVALLSLCRCEYEIIVEIRFHLQFVSGDIRLHCECTFVSCMANDAIENKMNYCHFEEGPPKWLYSASVHLNVHYMYYLYTNGLKAISYQRYLSLSLFISLSSIAKAINYLVLLLNKSCQTNRLVGNVDNWKMEFCDRRWTISIDFC